jgi:hypothetical protein
MLNEDIVNTKVLVFNANYTIYSGQPFHLRSFRISDIQYKIQNCVVKIIASIVCCGARLLWMIEKVNVDIMSLNPRNILIFSPLSLADSGSEYRRT